MPRTRRKSNEDIPNFFRIRLTSNLEAIMIVEVPRAPSDRPATLVLECRAAINTPPFPAQNTVRLSLSDLRAFHASLLAVLSETGRDDVSSESMPSVPQPYLRDERGDLNVRFANGEWVLNMVGYALSMAGATFRRTGMATQRDILKTVDGLSKLLTQYEVAAREHTAREELSRKRRAKYSVECRREDFVSALQLLMAAQKTGRFLQIDFVDGELVLTRGATSAHIPCAGTWFGTRGSRIGVIRDLWARRQELPDPVVMSVDESSLSVSHYRDVCGFVVTEESRLSREAVR